MKVWFIEGAVLILPALGSVELFEFFAVNPGGVPIPVRAAPRDGRHSQSRSEVAFAEWLACPLTALYNGLVAVWKAWLKRV
jgi:hypothetical protein